MQAMPGHDWDKYWHGRAQATGHAGVGVERNPVLQSFWQDLFTDQAPDKRVLDLGCGTGTVLKTASEAGLSRLTGQDISENAITLMQSEIPGAAAMVASLPHIPAADDSFDLVVSQYGFEYAGNIEQMKDTIREICRVLAPDGQFVAVSHMQDGVIAQESQELLQQINRVIHSGYFAAAQEMFTAAFALMASPGMESQNRLHTALLNMAAAEDPLQQWTNKELQTGNEFARFCQYLLASTREMFARHRTLNLDDCQQWLNGMEAEVHAYAGRMQSMLDAALSEQQVGQLAELFQHEGIRLDPPQAIAIDGQQSPGAWMIRSKAQEA